MANNLETVLLTIDLDDASLTRLERSYPNLKYLGNRVILFYVFENLDKIPTEEQREEEVFKKDEKLKLLADDISLKTGIEVRPVLQKGKAAEEILKAAEIYNARLIGMSTHSRAEDNHTQKHAMGSTTSKVVRQSKIPVFTFNNNVQLNPIKKILLPLDLSVETKQKVTNAISIAKKMGASINIVSIFWSPKFDDIKNQLKVQLEVVEDFIADGGVSVTSELIEAPGGERTVTPTILEYADKINADLIMIMTQQETRLAEFFMGSSAQTIIRHSKIPVMSIIPKELGVG